MVFPLDPSVCANLTLADGGKIMVYFKWNDKVVAHVAAMNCEYQDQK